MPIVNALCPTCGPQPTDHFSGPCGQCSLSPSERNWYGWIVEHEMGDALHRDGTLTPTRLLTCPREVLLQDFLPYILNPLFCNSAAVGTKIHEASSRSPLHLKGTLWGLDVEGECDNHQELTTGGWWIDDTKSHSDNTMGRINLQTGPSDEYKVQFGIYAILFEQMYPDRKVTRLTASHFSPLYRYSDFFDWKVVEVPIMSEEWIGQVRPLGNPFTVRQIAGFYQNALVVKHTIKLKPTDTMLGALIADNVPKVGAEMLKLKSGSWKCDHCHVRKECDALG